MAARRKSLQVVGTDRFPLIHVDPAELDDLIEQHGQSAELRRGIKCPCLRLETGLPAIGCPSCFGRGYLHPQKHREPIVVLLQNRSNKREDQAAGQLIHGDAQATFPRPIIAAPGDMILPDNETHIVQEVIYRAHQQLSGSDIRFRDSIGDYRVPEQSPTPDRLKYPRVSEVEAVFYEQAGTRAILEAVEGVEYTRTGQRIEWREGCGPSPARGYTVRYRAPAAYVVEYDPGMFRAEAGTAYPYRCSVSRLDQWTRGEEERR